MRVEEDRFSSHRRFCQARWLITTARQQTVFVALDSSPADPGFVAPPPLVAGSVTGEKSVCLSS